MHPTLKEKSPFYPGQPVPNDLFVGRRKQIEYIIQRGISQTADGKPAAFFIQGEYGIGKSSFANFVQRIAERDFGLHGIYASLGRAETLNDVGAAVLEGTLQSGIFNPKRSEKIQNWLAKYIGEQKLFGFTIHTEKLKKDAPGLVSGILPFLTQVCNRLKETEIKGVFLVLDEINGISNSPKFAHFIKDLVDSNALSRKPLPLLLMLCGVEERRREMIERHQPGARIFDVVEINPFPNKETRDFFIKTFGTVNTKVTSDALDVMAVYSGGFPKIMHLIGDAAYWIDRDGKINNEEATEAIFSAAEDVGRKYVDQQVYKAIRSKDYHSILEKITKRSFADLAFQKSKIADVLTPAEKKKFNGFLQKMKKLNVIRSGDSRGEYIFNSRMVQLYIFLNSLSRKRI